MGRVAQSRRLPAGVGARCLVKAPSLVADAPQGHSGPKSCRFGVFASLDGPEVASASPSGAGIAQAQASQPSTSNRHNNPFSEMTWPDALKTYSAPGSAIAMDNGKAALSKSITLIGSPL